MRAVLTLGATREYIDPVRFISNPSSGRMGVALLEVMQEDFATIDVVVGHIDIKLPRYSHVFYHHIGNIAELMEELDRYVKGASFLVMVMGIGDWVPIKTYTTKIPRTGEELHIALRPTEDIAALYKERYPSVTLVSFSAESSSGCIESILERALDKKKKKKAEWTFINQVYYEKRGFCVEETEGFLLGPENQVFKIPLGQKSDVVHAIWSYIRECE